MSDEAAVFVGVLWVFANISGMITFLQDGSIHSINPNFALMLFGYTQEQLIGKVSILRFMFVIYCMVCEYSTVLSVLFSAKFYLYDYLSCCFFFQPS